MTATALMEIEVASSGRKWPRYAKYRTLGLAWLADIPLHWGLKKFKHLGTIRYGLGEPPAQKEDGLLFIRATDVQRGKVNLRAIQRVDPVAIPWSRNPSLCPGDILVVRSGAYTGDSAIIPPELTGAIAGYDMIFRATRAFPEFVAYSLLSTYLLEGQIYLAKMRAAQPHLNAEELGSLSVVLPPVDEQRAIAAFLDRETAKIDKLIDGIAISEHASGIMARLARLMNEHRSALITAAVTGQIDVRNYHAEKTA